MAVREFQRSPIGVILLIGIVKKNGIMLVDSPCSSSATKARSGVDLQGLHPALPPHPHDHDGGAAGRCLMLGTGAGSNPPAAGLRIVGGDPVAAPDAVHDARSLHLPEAAVALRGTPRPPPPFLFQHTEVKAMLDRARSARTSTASSPRRPQRPRHPHVGGALNILLADVFALYLKTTSTGTSAGRICDYHLLPTSRPPALP